MRTKRILILTFCVIIYVQFFSIQVSAAEIGANTNSSANKYSSDWRYWSQGATQYVNSKMQSSGCRVVAQAKLLMETGIESGNSSFNPDTYIVWAHNNKHFGDSRPFTSYIGEQTGGKAPASYAASKGKNLTYHGQVSFSSTNVTKQCAEIMDYLNRGYFVILGNSAHHVYVGQSASLDAKTPVLFNSQSDCSYRDSLIIKYTDYIAKGKAPFSYIRLYSTNDISDTAITTSVTTNAATNITATSAQLNGSFSANGMVHITEHGAYLGTSTSNMTRVAKDTVNYNKSSLTMYYNTSKYGTTLKEDTTYYYYQYAVVNGKTLRGETLSFKTLPGQNPVPTAPSIKLDKTSIQEGETALLNWPSVANATSYVVTYIQTQDFVFVENTLNVITNQATLTKLGEGTYQIYVVAKGPSGTSGKSNTLTLTVTRPEQVTPEPISPPVPPVISISATSITERETATLTWADVPNSTEYEVQIQNVSGSDSGLISPFAKSPYTVSALEAGVYQINVVAYGSGGASEKSNTLTLTVTRPESTTSAPASPVISISATSITEGETVILTWANVPNSTGYDVQIEDVSSEWGSVWFSSYAKSPYTISDLEVGVYQIKAYAYDSNGKVSVPSNIVTLTIKPKASSVSATAKTNAAANITSASTQLSSG